MLDLPDFASMPFVDGLVLKPYLRRLLVRRNALIKQVAEGGG